MKILIIQLAKMGDLLQSNFLFKKLEGNEIILLHSDVFSEVIPFLEVNNSIAVNLDKLTKQIEDRFILQDNEYSQSIISQLNSMQFDLIINLNSNELASSFLANISSNRKIGFGSDDQYSKEWLGFVWSFIKSRKLNTINLVDIFLNIYQSERPSYSFWKEEKKAESNIVTFQLGSRNPKRQIPIHFFVDLGKLLIASGKKIQLVGVESEAKSADEFVNNFEESEIINLVGKTTINELFEIVGKSDYLITTDTGTMHIAASLKIPTLVFFVGPAYFAETSGYNPNQKIVASDSIKFSCYPCSDKDKCDFNLACRNDFDIKSIYADVFLAQENENILIPQYDEIGQIILPSQKQKLSEEIYFSLLYRTFAIRYFKHQKKTIENYLSHYTFKKSEIRQWNKNLSRELKLFDFIDFDYAKLKAAEENFKILKPLLYLYFILKTKNGIILDLINFFKEI